MPLRVRGRIQGDFLIYLPSTSILSEKIMQECHEVTLHGGVTTTMAKIRDKFLIPKLRQITKRVLRSCHGCKRFYAIPYPDPKLGLLPKDRTKENLPFKMIGTDYADPIHCKVKTKQTKTYILFFPCRITSAVHIELLPNENTSEFIKAFKKLIARRGSPNIVYSGNAKTYVAAAKWIRNIKRDVLFQDFLIKKEIQWKFNLSRAPWLGGQFERMVGLVKQSLYKATGYANLNLNELEEILLDIEVNLNNHPLTYLEDDVAFPVLTPNSLIFGQPTTLPEEDCAEDDGYTEMKKRSRYIKKCKESIWKRWNAEYLRALRERHNMKHKVKKMKISIGDVVLIKNEDRNRRKWKIGIVDKLYY